MDEKYNKAIACFASATTIVYVILVTILGIRYAERDILVTVVCFVAIIDCLTVWKDIIEGGFYEIKTWIRKQF